MNIHNDDALGLRGFAPGCLVYTDDGRHRLGHPLRMAGAWHEALESTGLSEGFIDTVLRPFFGGVFFDTGPATSNRVLRLVARSMLRGEIALPATGIGAVTLQLAANLPAGSGPRSEVGNGGRAGGSPEQDARAGWACRRCRRGAGSTRRSGRDEARRELE